MKCSNCGAEFAEGVFCPECGAVCGENVNTNAPKMEDGSEGWPLVDKRTVLLLSFLGGWLGLQHFYMRHYKKGAIYLLLGATGISFLLSIYEGFTYLNQSDTEFQVNNCVRLK